MKLRSIQGVKVQTLEGKFSQTEFIVTWSGLKRLVEAGVNVKAIEFNAYSEGVNGILIDIDN